MAIHLSQYVYPLSSPHPSLPPRHSIPLRPFTSASPRPGPWTSPQILRQPRSPEESPSVLSSASATSSLPSPLPSHHPFVCPNDHPL